MKRLDFHTTSSSAHNSSSDTARDDTTGSDTTQPDQQHSEHINHSRRHPQSSDTTSKVPTTLSTSTISSAGTSEGASTSASPSQSSTTAATAASITTAGVLSKSADCNSVLCDSGLQAAIAVPVVVAVLALIGLYFCLARRSRRRRTAANGAIAAPTMLEKGTPKHKEWSRHLRVFWFGDEILIGGRLSSTNSIRSRETGSTRSNRHESGNQSENPSISSLEEVAPPYRDIISTAQDPAHPTSVSGQQTHTERPSTATSSPPPYVMLGGSKGSHNLKRTQTPTSQRSQGDHSRDSNRRRDRGHLKRKQMVPTVPNHLWPGIVARPTPASICPEKIPGLAFGSLRLELSDFLLL